MSKTHAVTIAVQVPDDPDEATAMLHCARGWVCALCPGGATGEYGEHICRYESRGRALPEELLRQLGTAISEMVQS